MIFADKLIELRKKNGWTQEELAEHLSVSRQTISKWEGAQSVPDFKRMIQLSELFNVSTDYLLKDSIELEAPALPESSELMAVESGVSETVYPVSMETADRFMKLRENAAANISLGVMLCILSPVILIAFTSFAEVHENGLQTVITTGNGFGFLGSGLSIGIGVVILLIMIAIAVAMFIRQGMILQDYEYLEQQAIETEYGVSGLVREKKENYKSSHVTFIIIGVVLCVLSPVPTIIGAFFDDNGIRQHGFSYTVFGVCLLLILVAIGVRFIVRTSIMMGSYQILLEEGDYTRANKAESRRNEHITTIYWALVIALYLAISFLTNRWDATWIVWPVAGVLYGVLAAVLKMVHGTPA